MKSLRSWLGVERSAAPVLDDVEDKDARGMALSAGRVAAHQCGTLDNAVNAAYLTSAFWLSSRVRVASAFCDELMAVSPFSIAFMPSERAS